MEQQQIDEVFLAFHLQPLLVAHEGEHTVYRPQEVLARSEEAIGE
jgi:hypothetical protein